MIQTQLYSTAILTMGAPKTHLVGNFHSSLLKEGFHQQCFLFVLRRAPSKHIVSCYTSLLQHKQIARTNSKLISWVKRDQLDATCFIIILFSARHVSDVNASILRSLRLIRWFTPWVESGSMCVVVTLQCGYGGVVSVCRLMLIHPSSGACD